MKAKTPPLVKAHEELSTILTQWYQKELGGDFWGTANFFWGSNVTDAAGNVVEDIQIPVPSAHADLGSVAHAIALFTRDTITRLRGKALDDMPF